MRRWSLTGDPFADKEKRDIYEAAYSRLTNSSYSLKKWWARKYNRPMQDPILLDLSPYDIILEQMEDYIEAFCEERDGVTLEELSFYDIFPEDDPNGFDKMLVEARKHTQTLDEAYRLVRGWMKENPHGNKK